MSLARTCAIFSFHSDSKFSPYRYDVQYPMSSVLKKSMIMEKWPRHDRRVFDILTKGGGHSIQLSGRNKRDYKKAGIEPGIFEARWEGRGGKNIHPTNSRLARGALRIAKGFRGKRWKVVS